MIRVVVKFKSFSIMIYKTAAAIQKILRMSADAVLFRQFSCNFVKISIVDFIEAFLSNQFLILVRKKLLLFAM